jgi:hypothetical protein
LARVVLALAPSRCHPPASIPLPPIAQVHKPLARPLPLRCSFSLGLASAPASRPGLLENRSPPYCKIRIRAVSLLLLSHQFPPHLPVHSRSFSLSASFPFTSARCGASSPNAPQCLCAHSVSCSSGPPPRRVITTRVMTTEHILPGPGDRSSDGSVPHPPPLT